MATQAPEIDGVTLINDFEGAEPRPGEIRRLRITEAHDYDVVGTLLAPTEPAPPPAAVRIHQYFASCRRMMTCPICKKASRPGRPRIPVLQRALPASSIWATGPPEKYVIPGAPTSNPQEQEPEEDE